MPGILADKDRIFTQPLRGPTRLGPAGRQGCAAPGTASSDIVGQTPEWICDQLKASGLRGRGGAGLPHRPEVDLHAQGRRASVRTTCWSMPMKVGAGGLQGSRDPAQRSAPADRGLPDRLQAPCARTPPTSTSAANTCFERERMTGRHQAQAYKAKLIGKDNLHGWDCDVRAGAWGRGLHLRRRDGADGEFRGQEGPAAPEAAVPGRRRHLWLPHHGQQRRNYRGRGHDPAPRRRLVRQVSARKSPQG